MTEQNQAVNQGKYWTRDADHSLAEQYVKGLSIADIAEMLGRTESSILGRLIKICFSEKKASGENLVPTSNKPWIDQEDSKLIENYNKDVDFLGLSREMQRSVYELQARLVNLFEAKPTYLELISYRDKTVSSTKSKSTSSAVWTPGDLIELARMFGAGMTVVEMAKKFDRTVAGVVTQLLRRGLVEDNDIEFAVSRAQHRVNKSARLSNDEPF
jgi:hypothetical protein